MHDVRSGKLLPDFVNNYAETRVDVLTLAETRAAIEEAGADEKNSKHFPRTAVQ